MYKAEVVFGIVFVSHYDPSEVMQPSKQSFYFPASFVAPPSPAVLGFGLLAITAMRRDHLNALVGPSRIQSIRVLGPIPNEPLGSGLDPSVFKGGFYEGDFVRRSTLGVYGDRKTSAVCHGHDLRTFAPLGRTDLAPPFFAATNRPSMKHSLRSSPPRSSSRVRGCAE